jgi:hypothetical protein
VDGALKPEVEGLLKFKIMCFDWPHVLVRWTGRDASGDRWEPLENLNDCKEANTAFQRVTGSTLPRPTAQRPPLSAGPGPAPPAFPPNSRAGFIVDVAPPSDLGAAFVGRQLPVLYWWPDDGCQRGTVACLCQWPAF